MHTQITMQRPLTLALSVLLLVPSIAKAASIGVLASPGTAAAGSTVTLSVRANTVQDLAGVQFTLTSFVQIGPSSPPMISFANTTGIAVGPFLDGASLEVNPHGQALKVALARNQGANGTGVLLTVPVHIPEEATNGMVYEFQVIDVTAGNSNGQPLHLANGGEALVHVFSPGPSQAGITLGQGYAPAGGTADLRISATSRLQGATALSFVLHFDPSITVSPANVTPGSFLFGDFRVDASTPGQLKLSLSSSKAGEGPNMIAAVKFHLPSDAVPGKAFPVTVSDLNVTNSQGAPITTFATSGQILVTGTHEPPATIEGGLIRVRSVQVGRMGIANVTIEVNDKVTHLNGASFRLVFISRTPANAPSLNYRGVVKPGILLPGATLATELQNGPSISIGLASTRSSDGPGSLVTIPFQVAEQAQINTVYSLDLQNIVLSIDGVDKTCAVEGGTVSVVPNAKGDITGDGKVTTNDAILVLRIVIGSGDDNVGAVTADQRYAADANDDGAVTISDVVKLLKVIVGLESFN
jgi:hypothetical protein